MARQNPIFVSHGAPDLVISAHPARRFLSGFFDGRHRPKGIVIVSAHWMSARLSLTTGDHLTTIHDFRGFPAALYDIQYPARTDKHLIIRTSEALKHAGLNVAHDPDRGLDHGAWAPLSLMSPNADIPVVQLSLTPGSPSDHVAIGQALAPLADEDILVMASGSIVHNLRYLGPEGAPVPDWARTFDDSVVEALEDGDLATLDALLRTPVLKQAHPTTEHLMPLFVAVGAAGTSFRARRLHTSFAYQALSMTALEFETLKADDMAA